LRPSASAVCADGDYQPSLEVFGVPLIMVPDMTLGTGNCKKPPVLIGLQASFLIKIFFAIFKPIFMFFWKIFS
jgi:hypothetical protein